MGGGRTSQWLEVGHQTSRRSELILVGDLRSDLTLVRCQTWTDLTLVEGRTSH